MKRVAITGCGAISPLGRNVADFVSAIKAGRSAIRFMGDWDEYEGLRSFVAAPAELKDEKLIPRKDRRSMSRMSIFAVQAAQEALADAGLAVEDLPLDRTGCIVGSTTGSPISLNEAFEIIIPDKDLTNLTSMKFFQCVSHSAAMNLAQFLGLRGCVMATSAACASGLQALGAGYDLIRLGRQDLVLCGGAEELHPMTTGSFDMLYATSTGYNDHPTKTPRPFDRDRDGLVCGEGSGILLLEDYDRAVERGAEIHAEIVGYHTCGNGLHVSQSSKDAMVSCMREALRYAEMTPEDVDYVSAHATATPQGDKEEAEALAEVFGEGPLVSSLKGHIGHTLGASGPIELIASLSMMAEGTVWPTLNLENVSSDCEGISLAMEKTKRDINVFVKNSFAFGGINAAMVCRRVGDLDMEKA